LLKYLCLTAFLGWTDMKGTPITLPFFDPNPTNSTDSNRNLKT